MAEAQQLVQQSSNKAVEVVSVKCYSCGFTEECTPAYISRIRDRYSGRWICGLCIEAVKDEVLRSDTIISIEEALNRHISFCNQFKIGSPSSSTSEDHGEHPISALGRILRRSLDSPTSLRSKSSGDLGDVDEDVVRGPEMFRSRSWLSSLT